MYSSVQGIDLRLLQVFVTVAECQGFSAAQASLNMDQSTISTSMSTLESRLGYRLCERGKRGFCLTEEGARILKFAQDFFSSRDNFVTQVQGLSGRLFGQLVIGFIDGTITLKDARISASISRFYKRDQDVSIQLYIKSPTELEQAILDGKIHAAIAYSGQRIATLQYIELFKEKIAIYCGRAHPLFKKKHISLDEITESKWVRRGYIMPSQTIPVLPSMENMTAIAHQMESVALMVLAGTHLGYLPEHYAQHWVDRGDMRIIRQHQLGYEASHCLILHKKRPHNAALEAFITDVIEEHRIYKNTLL